MSNNHPLLSQVFTLQPPRAYGWKPSQVKPSADQFYVPHPKVLATLKALLDMRNQDGPIFDQGQLGSCVANGGLGNAQFVCHKDYGFFFVGSRLQAYLEGRKLEGTVDQDSGLEVHDIVTVLQNIGACPESEWPYDISKFTEQPPAKCYTDAAKFKIFKFQAVKQDLSNLKACLTERFPFIFGFNVPASFESSYTARTGIMTMPKAGEQIIGGHCVMGIGYIDAEGKAHFASAIDRIAYTCNRWLSNLQHGLRVLTGVRLLKVAPPTNVIICRNSWGTGWGDNGYFYMPYAFITDPKWCSDFWTIQSMSNPQAAA